ncbi:hypothetical protein Mapa_007816 [Marchantia paleacea]|nr:hypothetical protein Mapa_007816 [Marchantia paleacea]
MCIIMKFLSMIQHLENLLPKIYLSNANCKDHTHRTKRIPYEKHIQLASEIDSKARLRASRTPAGDNYDTQIMNLI